MPPIGDDEDLTNDLAEGEESTQQVEGDAAEPADGDGEAPAGQGDDDDAELLVTFEGEEPPEEAAEPDLIKHLRAENRRLAKEVAEARRAAPDAASPKIEVGPKPTLESCDYDEARFEAELDEWKERKAKADTAETEARQVEERRQEAFRADFERFTRHKAEIRAPDFEEAENVVAAVLSKEQASALLQATENSAKVIYALGKRPERLKALAAETNIVKFIANVAKLEGSVKVTTTRRAPPEPDEPERGAGRLSPVVDKKLEALEKEADRTGDRTKVQAYKRELRAKAGKNGGRE